jgi:hypothetical protein
MEATPEPKQLPRATLYSDQNAKRLAGKAFGLSNGEFNGLIAALADVAAAIYSAAAKKAYDELEENPADTATNHGKAFLSVLLKDANGNNNRAKSLAENRLSKIFATYQQHRMGDGREKSTSMVAFMDTQYTVMFWMYAVSTDQSIASAFDSASQKLVDDSKLHKTPRGSLYFWDSKNGGADSHTYPDKSNDGMWLEQAAAVESADHGLDDVAPAPGALPSYVLAP